ncbi:MAG: hypothetical protein WDM77_10350 [Steroidobacteraceae bacterium]
MRKSGRRFFALVLLCAVCSPSPAQKLALLAVHLDTSRTGPVIDRNFFGPFAEHLGSGIYGGVWAGKDSAIANVCGIRSDVVTALRALQVPNVRRPGGCYADEYQWRDGIGPESSGKATVNTNWGGAAKTNHFGSGEFMDFINPIGSEAYVSVNVGSGSAREPAEWTEYLTAAATTSAGRERAANGHPEPYRVKFLGIGNESWGCGGAMSADSYVNQMRVYSRFVHNYNPVQSGDQSMRRIAVGADGAKSDCDEAVMKAWHGKDWSWDLQALCLHSYSTAGSPPAHPSTGFGESEYAQLLNDTLKMQGLISVHSALMDRYDPKKKIALAVDERGVWLAPTPGTHPSLLVQQNSLRDAILAGLNLNAHAARAEVLTAPQVDSVNSFAQPDQVVPTAIVGEIIQGRLLITLPVKSIAVLQIN